MTLGEAYEILRQFYLWRHSGGRVHHPKGLDKALKIILEHEDKRSQEEAG